MLATAPDQVLARLRALCLALPDASEKLSHGAPAFQAGDGKAAKMFAYFRHDHHGDGRTVVCVNTGGREEQEMLMEAEPEVFSWPAYIGGAGWIAMDLGDPDADWAHVAARLARSHTLAGEVKRRR